MGQPNPGRVHALGYNRLSGAREETLLDYVHPCRLHDRGMFLVPDDFEECVRFRHDGWLWCGRCIPDHLYSMVLLVVPKGS